MITAFGKSIPFLLGFSFALLPNYGPFLGLLFFFASRWILTRTDALWMGAAFLLSLPLGFREGLAGFSFGTLQILAPWLLYRTFAQLHVSHYSLVFSRSVGIGLLSGLALVVGLGWLQIEQLNFDHAKTISQAIVWEANPALYGHTVFTLGALMAVLLPGGRKRSLSMMLAALGVLVSGSREAAIAWVVVAFALLLVSIRHTKRRWLAETAVLIGMLAIAAGFGPLLGWGQTGFLLDILPSTGSTQNLVQGSEILNGDWWNRMGVQVNPASTFIGDKELTSYTVTKVAPESWQRLQQIIPLSAGTTYTVSAWLKQPEEGIRAGIQGWGQLDGERRTFTVTGRLVDGDWRSSLSGPGQITGSGIVEVLGEWQRVWISFVYEGDQPTLQFWVGLAPDAQHSVGTTATFAAFQIEEGDKPSQYAPGPATRGLSLGVARLPYWQAAWRGILERPLFGWGQDSFPEYYRTNWPDRGRLHDVPAHVHNFFLHVLFERGLVGLAGLVLFLIGLIHTAVRRGDAAFLIVFFAIMLMNVFDSTLFYGGVLYPLVAIAGWRGAYYQTKDPERESVTKQTIARFGLAGIDFIMALLAFGLAVWSWLWLNALFSLSSNLNFLGSGIVIYALLLWPAMAWREGLYPGYGLTAPQELRKQVTAVAQAGLILTAGTLLFASSLPIPRTALLLTVLYSMVLTLVGRGLAKRLLHRLGIWGRSVVILGAGATGQSVAKALCSNPLGGLHPVAFFDDDPSKVGTAFQGVTVKGSLQTANAYAEEREVRHAIVAIPRVPKEALSELVGHKGKAFRQVQFVPDLKGLPAEDVFASNLGGILALEVRNGLHSRTNQVFKRCLDLVAGMVGTLFIAPVLLLIYLWVRLDSAGPGFYWSERIGQNGKIFKCLKFRSMYIDAEERLQEMMAADPVVRQEYEAYHKLEHDPRVTRVGRVIRKFSLDELAQLYNVIVGDMSLIGPRPYLKREFEDMGKYADVILEAKPGITGYWQVSGRNEVTFRERLEMESHYVRNWSIWWDIILLVQTASVVVRRRGAH